MTLIRRLTPAIILLALAFVVAACGTSAPSPSLAPVTPPGGAVDATGDWRLIGGTDSGDQVPIVAGADITMTVTGSGISGRAACNLYGGELVVTDGQVRFGLLSMTEMACEDPVMASEAAYLAALGKVSNASRTGDRLTLTGDTVELVFERLAPPPTADLTETDWVLDSLITADAVSSVAGDPATLRLDADGAVSGSTGCRSFTGRWTIANGEILFTDYAMDGSECGADLAAQDDHVVTVLGDGFRAAVKGERLTLTAGDGLGLGYWTRLPQIPQAP